MTPVTFITGASSGLGRGLALRLAADGYAVGLAARRAELLDELAREIRERGGRAHPFPCDVTIREEVEEAVRACQEELGPVDLLVCSAGISEMSDGRSLSVDVVERVFRVNVLGSLYAVGAVLPGMLERDRGHLVGIGSLAGYGGLPKTAAYSASKAALANLFESLRLDLRGTGVDVTFLAPGWIRTPLTDRNLHPMPFMLELDEGVERMVRAIRRRRRLLSFPRPLSTIVWLARLFPRWLYDLIASAIRRDKAEPEAALAEGAARDG